LPDLLRWMSLQHVVTNRFHPHIFNSARFLFCGARNSMPETVWRGESTSTRGHLTTWERVNLSPIHGPRCACVTVEQLQSRPVCCDYWQRQTLHRAGKEPKTRRCTKEHPKRCEYNCSAGGAETQACTARQRGHAHLRRAAIYSSKAASGTARACPSDQPIPARRAIACRIR
jgi:hypothetical protein